MNEAGGKHYGNGTWHLQRDMQTWGSVFIDARRTDAIKHLFRKKGDKSKQLDDAHKALHNVQVIIEELEIEEKQIELAFESKTTCPVNHTLDNAKFINYDTPKYTCLVCGNDWPLDQVYVIDLNTPDLK